MCEDIGTEEQREEIEIELGVKQVPAVRLVLGKTGEITISIILVVLSSLL